MFPDIVVAEWDLLFCLLLVYSYIVMGREGEEMGGKNFYKKV